MPLLETKGAGSAQGFGEFTASAPKVYIEDVFSTYLYTGNSNTRTVTNGIDLLGKGGLVWIKNRGGTGADQFSNALWDTARGAGTTYIGTSTKILSSNQTAGQGAGTYLQGGEADYLSSFTSTGFVVTATPNYPALANNTGNNYVSWTFRKQPKFFDVVTYTGNGTAGRTVAHNLGSVPGMIIVKKTDAIGNWSVYHRSLGNTNSLELQSTNASFSSPTNWNNTTPTSTVFTVGTDVSVNENGKAYVAYLFAHDAGGFGLSGTDNVISCGSFTTDGSGVIPAVTLGYEPQWLLIKETSGANSWFVFDNMRQMSMTNAAYLNPNSSGAEALFGYGVIAPTATGFVGQSGSPAWNPSATFIYIAIRRGPMKVPTSGTSVFSPNAVTSSSGNTTVTAGFPVDLSILKLRDFADGARWIDRLRGITSSTTPEINSTSTSAEFTSTDIINAGQTTVQIGPIGTYSCVNWNFRRAPGFFDVVCYTGTGSARTVAHNLGVAPEMMIVKRRNIDRAWAIYHSGIGATKYLFFTTAAAGTSNQFWNDTTPTSSVFTVATNLGVNGSGDTYVAYLFATCPGVSKVGSYTGTGTTLQIDCGFTGGARFVLIKRTDSTGDWYVWDTARGIVSGNDPYLLLNSTAAEVTNTDYVDTYSAGFELSSTAPAGLNANGGTFVFLAVA
jgi:hypothetical protein